MTEQKWYGFSGLMNECIFHLDNHECPYHKYRDLDQYERLEQLMNISDRQAENIFNKCREFRIECKPEQIHSPKLKQVNLIEELLLK